MNEKEKAHQLVNRFGLQTGRLNKYYEVIYDLSKAKQCALILVDEIIEELKAWKVPGSYWETVREEIKLM